MALTDKEIDEACVAEDMGSGVTAVGYRLARWAYDRGVEDCAEKCRELKHRVDEHRESRSGGSAILVIHGGSAISKGEIVVDESSRDEVDAEGSGLPEFVDEGRESGESDVEVQAR